MASPAVAVEYHPLSSHVVHQETGYFDSLTDAQRAVRWRRPGAAWAVGVASRRTSLRVQALEQLRERYPTEKCSFGIPDEHHDMMLLRYLRAREFDVAKTSEMLDHTLVRGCSARPPLAAASRARPQVWRKEAKVDEMRDSGDPNVLLGFPFRELVTDLYPQVRSASPLRPRAASPHQHARNCAS